MAYAAGMAASTIPLIPGGIGVVEGALTVGLVAGGMPAADAIAAVIVYRLISLVMIAAIGWALWLIVRVRQGKTVAPDDALAQVASRLQARGVGSRLIQQAREVVDAGQLPAASQQVALQELL